MLDFMSRRRAGVALTTILLTLLAWMSYQKKYPDQSTLLERVVYETLSPVVVATSNATERLTRLENRYRELREAEDRYEEAAREVAELTKEVDVAREAIQENERLKALLAFREAARDDYHAARVLSADPRSPWGAMWINVGRSGGIVTSAGVVTPDGIVGKVIEVAAPASKVKLVTDAESGVGGLVQRSRAVGVVMGRGDGILEMRYLSHVDDVRKGDLVVTSGLDGIFPRGLVIGTVVSVESRPDLQKEALIEPAVALKNVEHVLVSTQPSDLVPFLALMGNEDGGEEPDTE